MRIVSILLSTAVCVERIRATFALVGRMYLNIKNLHLLVGRQEVL